MRTLTCNKLSHCLFDFDCTDFNIYEREQYNYQEFTYRPSASRKRGMIHDKHQPEHKTSHDTYVMRDSLRVKCENVDKAKQLIYNSDKFVLRFFYKHKEGTLWCFNKPTVDN